jgi:hypothetical protein
MKYLAPSVDRIDLLRENIEPISSALALVLQVSHTDLISTSSTNGYTSAHTWSLRTLSCPVFFLDAIFSWPSGQSSWLQTQRGPGLDYRSYHISLKVMGLERGSLSLVSSIEELLWRKSSDSGPEIREYGRGDVALTTLYTISANVGTSFTDKRRSLGRHTSLADYDHGASY